jgi:hypothetical protein
MELTKIIQNPMVKVSLVVAVAVAILFSAIFFSKKVVIDGNECYIMPGLGTVRCGLAHKFIYGGIAVLLVVSVIAFFSWTKYMESKLSTNSE